MLIAAMSPLISIMCCFAVEGKDAKQDFYVKNCNKFQNQQDFLFTSSRILKLKESIKTAQHPSLPPTIIYFTNVTNKKFKYQIHSIHRRVYPAPRLMFCGLISPTLNVIDPLWQKYFQKNQISRLTSIYQKFF